MPYELYWRGPLSAFLIYAEKARLESDRDNRTAWLNGLYAREALLSVYKFFNPLVKKESAESKYPSEPLKPKKPITPEQERRRQEITDMILKHNQEIREKLGR